MKRYSDAVWRGPGRDGRGHLTTESKALVQMQYSFDSRFGDMPGANPEELIAAAHAGCFTMKLSFVLGEAGFVAEQIETRSYINFEKGAISGSHLVVKARIPGISEEVFEASVKDAEVNCPVSRVLNGKITVEATLMEG